MAAIVQQIRALDVLLANLGEIDTDMKSNITQQQVQKCKVSIERQGPVDALALSELSRSIIVSSLPDISKRELQQALVASSVSLHVQGGTKFQDYTSMRNLITESVAGQAGTPGFSSALFKLIAKLGLRKGSENTYKELTLVQLLATDGLEKVMALSVEARSAMVASSKILFKNVLKSLPAPQVWMWSLLETPAELKIQHPLLWEDVYAMDHPVPMQLDDCTLQYLRHGARCRKQKEFRGAMGNMGNMGNMGMNMKEIMQQIRQDVVASIRDDGDIGRQIHRPALQDGGIQIFRPPTAPPSRAPALLNAEAAPTPGPQEPAGAPTPGPQEPASTTEHKPEATAEPPHGKKLSVMETMKNIDAAMTNKKSSRSREEEAEESSRRGEQHR